MLAQVFLDNGPGVRTLNWSHICPCISHSIRTYNVYKSRASIIFCAHRVQLTYYSSSSRYPKINPWYSIQMFTPHITVVEKTA